MAKYSVKLVPCTIICAADTHRYTQHFMSFRSVDRSLNLDMHHSSIVMIQKTHFLRISNKNISGGFVYFSVYII
jgi:hypothetical protein